MAGWGQREKEHLSSLLPHGLSLLASTLPLGGDVQGTNAAHFLVPTFVVGS